ncbi:protein FAR1-RELATED SEQUENCE 8-like [Arachis duranensis]|uniref:Protein FAR1-RELATED SEQUENCE 8-like n=1 Tax=Arachis duranensis TaxID=130453 RepID=A0A9C6TEM6_ARADU|nr:protein FAR1-RELATED SEQUENCE 8-like [Arachis duranensis]
MACNVVQSPCHVPSSIPDHNSSKPHEDAPDHFVTNGQQSNKVPDHDGLREDEIPSVGMRFEQLQMAHEFYMTYAKKVGFATKIRMTTCDKITNQLINQAIHCNRDGYRGSHVKASTQKNMISAAGCKARIYVKFDKETQDWVFFKVELSHSHPCSTRKAMHYHEYRKLTMHAKCVIEDNDEAGIRRFD